MVSGICHNNKRAIKQKTNGSLQIASRNYNLHYLKCFVSTDNDVNHSNSVKAYVVSRIPRNFKGVFNVKQPLAYYNITCHYSPPPNFFLIIYKNVMKIPETTEAKNTASASGSKDVKNKVSFFHPNIEPHSSSHVSRAFPIWQTIFCRQR